MKSLQCVSQSSCCHVTIWGVRRSSHQSRLGKIWRWRLIVIVHVRQAILIKEANLRIVPELKAALSKTLETPDGGLFCIGCQRRAKSVLKSETATPLPAKRA